MNFVDPQKSETCSAFYFLSMVVAQASRGKTTHSTREDGTCSFAFHNRVQFIQLFYYANLFYTRIL